MPSPYRIVMLLMLTAGLSFVVAGCCCPQQSPEQKKKTKKEMRKSLKTFSKIARDAKKAKPKKPKKCPDKLFTKVAGNDMGLWGKPVDYKAIAPMTKKKGRLEVDKDWDFLTWDTLQQLDGYTHGERVEKRAGDIRWAAGHKESRFVGVFKATSKKTRRAPRVTGEGNKLFLSKERELEAGDHFMPGRFDGWILIYDRESAKRVCQTPIRARGLNYLTYKYKGMLATDAESAVKKDFLEQFNKAIKRSLGRVTKVLKLSVY